MIHETFCRVCGLIFDTPREKTKYCASRKCQNEATRRRRVVRQEKINRGIMPLKEEVYRPFYVCDQLHILQEFNRGQTIEEIADETERFPEQVTHILSISIPIGVEKLEIQRAQEADDPRSPMREGLRRNNNKKLQL